MQSKALTRIVPGPMEPTVLTRERLGLSKMLTQGATAESRHSLKFWKLGPGTRGRRWWKIVAFLDQRICILAQHTSGPGGMVVGKPLTLNTTHPILATPSNRPPGILAGFLVT